MNKNKMIPDETSVAQVCVAFVVPFYLPDKEGKTESATCFRHWVLRLLTACG